MFAFLKPKGIMEKRALAPKKSINLMNINVKTMYHDKTLIILIILSICKIFNWNILIKP